MKKLLHIESTEKVIGACTDVVYAQRKYWCDSTVRPLKLSVLRPRSFFGYDPKEKTPLIVWLCGGGFTEVDQNCLLYTSDDGAFRPF